MERGDGLAWASAEREVGGSIGLGGKESVVERWMLVRRVERKAAWEAC